MMPPASEEMLNVRLVHLPILASLHSRGRQPHGSVRVRTQVVIVPPVVQVEILHLFVDLSHNMLSMTSMETELHLMQVQMTFVFHEIVSVISLMTEGTIHGVGIVPEHFDERR